MKIWKLYVFWEGKKDNIIRFVDRKISRLDLERIDKYLDGGFHIHRNPGKKEKKVPAPPLTAGELQNLLKEDNCQPETCAGQCQGMNSRTECQNIEEDKIHAALPRHTPEELDRLISTVRKVESPDHLTEEKE